MPNKRPDGTSHVRIRITSVSGKHRTLGAYKIAVHQVYKRDISHDEHIGYINVMELYLYEGMTIEFTRFLRAK